MSAQDSTDYEQYLPLIYRGLEGIGKKPNDWSENTDLESEVGLTSLQAMELIALLEDELDVTIPLNVLPDVRTIRDLAVQVAQFSE